MIYAIPLTLNTEAILHANNTRDVEGDRQAGIVTLAILAGWTGSYAIFLVLLFVPYFVFLLLTFCVSTYFIIPLMTVFMTFDLERRYRQRQLDKLPQEVGKLNLFLAVTYTLACALADYRHLPGLV